MVVLVAGITTGLVRDVDDEGEVALDVRVYDSAKLNNKIIVRSMAKGLDVKTFFVFLLFLNTNAF